MSWLKIRHWIEFKKQEKRMVSEAFDTLIKAGLRIPRRRKCGFCFGTGAQQSMDTNRTFKIACPYCNGTGKAIIYFAKRYNMYDK